MNIDAGAGPHGGTAPRPSPGDVPAVVLVRHGETEWSATGRHTGRTDVPLTDDGQAQASAVGSLIRRVLAGGDPYVISSPRRRALDTARLAGFPPDEVSELAAEWDYGDLEGLTSAEIRERLPGWSIWSGPVPGGESAEAVTGRLDLLLGHIQRLRDADPERPVVVFSHGHASRCLAARWLGEEVSYGGGLWLTTGAVSVLGYERERPVILRWNVDASLTDSSKVAL